MICFVDYKTTDEECNNLNKLGLKIIKIPQSKALYNAIDGHVDIQINILHKENRLILINKHMPDEFKKQLEENNIKFVTYTNIRKEKYRIETIIYKGRVEKTYNN